MERPRRKYTEGPRKARSRDVDAVGRARSVQALGWALFAGLPMGGLVGLVLGHPFLGLILGPGLIWLVAVGLAEIMGRGASGLYAPSGSRTPRRTDYSYAESLAVRGELEEAVAVYEAAILEAPEDPEPYLRIARLQRDGRKDLDEAVAWFKRALREATVSGGQEVRARRELAEIYLYQRHEPRRAAPELARLAERFPELPDGAWAAGELQKIKEEMAREDEP